ncbi:MAG: FAD-dependent oxidoreductase, partial [Rhizobiaceae bacterium]
MRSFDAIVIGAGVNGLSAAGRLALSGARVAVVEKSERIGGAMDTVEFMPGYRASGVAHLVFMPDARVIKALELTRHGFALAAEGIATTALAADGRHLRLEGDFGETIAGDLDAGDRAEWALL